MRITSLNIGSRRQMNGKSFKGETGIFKIPVTHAVSLDKLGLANDAVVNTRHHGGEDQAVYLYRTEDYAWWSEQLGEKVPPGAFGENLTLSGLPEPGIAIGARIDFPHVTLEITAPRIPCNTLASRMGDPGFLKRFIEAERPGLYCRVIREGEIAPGEAFTLDESCASDVTTIDMFKASYRKLSLDELDWLLTAPIDMRSRHKWEREREAAR